VNLFCFLFLFLLFKKVVEKYFSLILFLSMMIINYEKVNCTLNFETCSLPIS
jgi:hypothetical protein